MISLTKQNGRSWRVGETEKGEDDMEEEERMMKKPAMIYKSYSPTILLAIRGIRFHLSSVRCRDTIVSRTNDGVNMLTCNPKSKAERTVKITWSDRDQTLAINGPLAL